MYDCRSEFYFGPYPGPGSFGYRWLPGPSHEIGAFIAGLMIVEAEHSEHALGKLLPLGDTFTCLFFASIGMLSDPGEHPLQIHSVLEWIRHDRYRSIRPLREK